MGLISNRPPYTQSIERNLSWGHREKKDKPMCVILVARDRYWFYYLQHLS
jgi:hypothetical protein